MYIDTKIIKQVIIYGSLVTVLVLDYFYSNGLFFYWIFAMFFYLLYQLNIRSVKDYTIRKRRGENTVPRRVYFLKTILKRQERIHIYDLLHFRPLKLKRYLSDPIADYFKNNPHEPETREFIRLFNNESSEILKRYQYEEDRYKYQYSYVKETHLLLNNNVNEFLSLHKELLQIKEKLQENNRKQIKNSASIYGTKFIIDNAVFQRIYNLYQGTITEAAYREHTYKYKLYNYLQLRFLKGYYIHTENKDLANNIQTKIDELMIP